MLCPRCDSVLVVRRSVPRPLNGFLSLFSIYPFQCRSCNHHFRAVHAEERRDPVSPVERRKSARVPVQVPVRFEYGEGPGEGTITDISKDGCTLDSKRRLRPGLLLCLYLPAGKEGWQDIAAQQVASVRTTHGDRAGLKFLAFTPQERRDLKHTITNTMKKFLSK